MGRSRYRRDCFELQSSSFATRNASGNQTVRLAGGKLHLLAYDAENRLTTVSERSSFSAAIGRSGTSVVLSWAAVPGAVAYEVWRGTTPYFTPGEAGTTKAATTTGASYSDPGRSGDPAANYYYLILATANACPLAASRRIGEFDFALTPGAALNVAAVRALDQPGLLDRPLAVFPQASLADTPIASFVYDADGRRVSATVAGVTTVYPFAHYEVAGTTIRKYYFLGGQRAAMRTAGALSYLLTDHLNSTSVSTDSGGAATGRSGYLPYGAPRYTLGTLPTAPSVNEPPPPTGPIMA